MDGWVYRLHLPLHLFSCLLTQKDSKVKYIYGVVKVCYRQQKPSSRLFLGCLLEFTHSDIDTNISIAKDNIVIKAAWWYVG